jgi:hypothetical protein
MGPSLDIAVTLVQLLNLDEVDWSQRQERQDVLRQSLDYFLVFL